MTQSLKLIDLQIRTGQGDTPVFEPGDLLDGLARAKEEDAWKLLFNFQAEDGTVLSLSLRLNEDNWLLYGYVQTDQGIRQEVTLPSIMEEVQKELADRYPDLHPHLS